MFVETISYNNKTLSYNDKTFNYSSNIVLKIS